MRCWAFLQRFKLPLPLSVAVLPFAVAVAFAVSYVPSPTFHALLLVCAVAKQLNNLCKSSVNHVQIVNYASVPEIGIAIGIGIEKMVLGHEKLDVYRLAIGYLAWVFEKSEKLNGAHRHARNQWIRASQSIPLNIA